MSDDTTTSKALKPQAPALLPADWAPLAGQIGPEPEDFVVDEIPLYEPSGEGEHLYLHLQKRLLNSEDLVKRVAQASGVPAKDVGYAGMKDRHAVTTQWMSLATKADPSDWDFGEGVTLLGQGRHGNKLRTGHLSGNRFAIRLVELSNVEALVERAESLRQTGVLNGFDAQRFGREGRNLERALAWVRGENRRVSPFQRKLFASVLQSQVFNLVLEERSQRDLLTVQVGDVLRLDGNRSVFTSEDAHVDEARRVAGDVHITGPMFGPKAAAAQGEPLAIENAAIARLGLDAQALEQLARNGQGTRRDFFTAVPDISVDVEDAQTAVVRFTLVSGAYATNVIRHLLRQPWSEDMRGSGGVE